MGISPRKGVCMAEYKAAAYLRLSSEDGDKAESESIGNQRTLIKEFINKKPEITMTEEYVDDGYSGTSYDRPGFKRMIEDIKAGKINCVVVKDLSRLGRNYIETGKYIEKIFPFLGVRFIAINDSYDSADVTDDTGQIIIPFKNLINDAYCRDISMKIKSQFDVKRREGKFIGSFTPYGYKKDPNDKNHLIVDEYAAGIVREIFRMRLEGYSQKSIANHLNELGVLTPAEYKRKCGERYTFGFHAGSSPKWEAQTVRYILANEMYIGTMVQGKYRKVSYKVKACKPLPKEEWTRVENCHEPIIPASVFETAQRLAQMDVKTPKCQETEYPFSGLVECGDCGNNMIHGANRSRGKQYPFLACATYVATKKCSSHFIRVEKLEKIVLGAINGQAEALIESEQIIEQLEHRMPEAGFLDTQIAALADEARRYHDLKQKAYVDMLDGTLSREEYSALAARFATKAADAENRQQELLKKKHRMEQEKGRPKKWLEDFKKCKGIFQLDRQTMLSLVEKIIVYSTDNIEIVFVHGDEIKEIMTAAGMDPNLNIIVGTKVVTTEAEDDIIPVPRINVMSRSTMHAAGMDSNPNIIPATIASNNEVPNNEASNNEAECDVIPVPRMMVMPRSAMKMGDMA